MTERGTLKPLRIVYVGAGLSGKHESLGHVLRASGIADPPPSVRRHPLPVPWGGRWWPVVASAAHTLARYGSHDPPDPWDPDVSPWLIAELDDVRRADGLIFVVDARTFRAHASQHFLELLAGDLDGYRAIDELPIVFQVNAIAPESYQLQESGPGGVTRESPAELKALLPLSWARTHFRSGTCAYVESDSNSGRGTMEAMTEVVRLIVEPGRERAAEHIGPAPGGGTGA